MIGMQQLKSKFFPKGAFIRSVSLLAGGTAIAQAIAVLAAPVLTRLYRAEDFGYLQIYMSVMAFAVVAVTLRFDQAVFLPEQDSVAANVLVVALASVFGFTASSACVLFFLNKAQLWNNDKTLQPFLWLVPIAMCGAGVYQSLSAWALRQKGYSRVSGTKITQVGSQIGTQIFSGIFYSGPLGLIVGDAIGRFAGSLSLAKFAWNRSSAVFRAVRLPACWAAAVRYKRFPLLSSSAALIGVAASAVPPLLIASFYGAKTLGWFALGDRVLGAPSILIGQAISQVYSVDAASLNATQPAKLHSLFLKAAKRLALIGLVPYSLFLIFAPSAFSFVFGGQWREAGEYARILALMHYAGFIVWPLTPTLNLLEQQVWQFAWDSGRMVFTLASLWVVSRFGGSARVAVGAFGFTMLLGYVCHLLLSHHAIKLRTKNHKEGVAYEPTAIPYAEALK